MTKKTLDQTVEIDVTCWCGCGSAQPHQEECDECGWVYADGDPDDQETEDDGRWSGGYRYYRNGSYREDFRSDC